jgi:hypothetical protein
MAQLSVVFPAINIQPDIYYRLLDDLREDNFLGGINKICREVRELFPNTNLVALIREKTNEYCVESIGKRRALEDRKKLEFKEPDYDSPELKKAREDFNKMRESIAEKMDMNKAIQKGKKK